MVSKNFFIVETRPARHGVALGQIVATLFGGRSPKTDLLCAV